MSTKLKSLFLTMMMLISVSLMPVVSAQDTDQDGVLDEEDACPNEYGEAENGCPDSDDDGVPDNEDEFPDNPDEQYDDDGDGVGNNEDAFPEDENEQYDSDDDGVGDNEDAFPDNPEEQYDTDNDGMGDNEDAFPEDPDEQYDSDGDGLGDNGDNCPYEYAMTEDGCPKEETMYVQYKDFNDETHNCDDRTGNGESINDSNEECWDGYLRQDKNEIKIVSENLNNAKDYTLEITEGEGHYNQPTHYHDMKFHYDAKNISDEEYSSYEERLHIHSDAPQHICHRSIEISLFGYDDNGDMYHISHFYDSNSYNCQPPPMPHWSISKQGGAELSESDYSAGETLELEWNIHTLDNSSNYLFEWYVYDAFNDDLFAPEPVLTKNVTIAGSDISGNGEFVIPWSLDIPETSCVINFRADLYEIDDNGSKIDRIYGNYDYTNPILCEWVRDLDKEFDNFTAEAFLEMTSDGLVLNIQESYNIFAHYYIEYESGNRDGVMTQEEFDIFFESWYDEIQGADCIEGEIGNSWEMNGMPVKKDHSYCEVTFDDTGIKFSAFVLMNGTWEPNQEGEWVLDIYRGHVYETCEPQDYNEDGVVDYYNCQTNRLAEDWWNMDRTTCTEDNSQWTCYTEEWEQENGPYDNCDENGNYYVCSKEGNYESRSYQADQCESHERGYYCEDDSNNEVYWETIDSDEKCEWNADRNVEEWECEDADGNPTGRFAYCEPAIDDGGWYCTRDFHHNQAYGNTSENTHYMDGTVPEEERGTLVRYGVTSNSEYDLKKGKFVTEDGVALMMAISSGSGYVDIPYNWDTISSGQFVWRAATGDDGSDGDNTNDDNNNSNETSTENRLPVCQVFAVAQVGATGAIQASEISKKVEGSKALVAPLSGAATLPLIPGTYEFMVDCTDPDGDDLVITISDGVMTVTAEAMDGHFFGGLGFNVDETADFTQDVKMTWTDGTESGELVITFTTDLADLADDVAESGLAGLPGFTTPLSMLALLGAAMLLGRSRREN